MTLETARKEPPSRQAFSLSDSDFRRIADFALREAGLSIPASKQKMVQSRIERHLRSIGVRSFATFLSRLDNDEPARRELVSVLTTNVTSFFREEHHFTALRETILPHLIASARQGARVRIWSAGCSRGQEPYSLAMLLLDMLPEAPELDIRILATDIDTNALSRAIDGRYDPDEIRGIPKDLARRFLENPPERKGHVVSSVLRSVIAFRRLNLVADWPMKSRFDVIMCRNVAIYFDGATQTTLWRKFRDRLSPGGWLMLGHSERIAEPAALGFRAAGITSYQLSAPPASDPRYKFGSTDNGAA